MNHHLASSWIGTGAQASFAPITRRGFAEASSPTNASAAAELWGLAAPKPLSLLGDGRKMRPRSSIEAEKRLGLRVP